MNDQATILILLRTSKKLESSPWYIKNNTLHHKKNDQSEIAYSSFQNAFVKSTNKEIYDKNIKNLIKEATDGMNCTIFAYGQTGSGKTHTMMGEETDNGIIKLAIEDVFSDNEISVSISYVEIYNEKIYDLIEPKNAVQLYNVANVPVLKNAAEFKGRTKQCVFNLIKDCEERRKIGSTEYNNKSSRSHTIFIMNLTKAGKKSVINLIDLAGSEKATGDKDRRLEGSFINKSLLALGTVVNNMAGNSSNVGFRDSKLTRMLQQSMNGRVRIVALCTISPLSRCVEESISTLNFAARLGKIKLDVKNVKGEEIIEKPANICTMCQCSLNKKHEIEKDLKFERETEKQTSGNVDYGTNENFATAIGPFNVNFTIPPDVVFYRVSSNEKNKKMNNAGKNKTVIKTKKTKNPYNAKFLQNELLRSYYKKIRLAMLLFESYLAFILSFIFQNESFVLANEQKNMKQLRCDILSIQNKTTMERIIEMDGSNKNSINSDHSTLSTFKEDEVMNYKKIIERLSQENEFLKAKTKIYAEHILNVDEMFKTQKTNDTKTVAYNIEKKIVNLKINFLNRKYKKLNKGAD